MGASRSGAVLEKAQYSLVVASCKVSFGGRVFVEKAANFAKAKREGWLC
jgi:hypothetical protein